MSKKKVFLDTLKSFRAAVLLYFVICLTNFVVFILYNLSAEPLIYSAVLGAFFLVIIFIIQFLISLKKSEKRNRIISSIATSWNELEEASSLLESDYIMMLKKLGEDMSKVINNYNDDKIRDDDFYTSWVHQVKTPIAVIKLMLDLSDGIDKNLLECELFRIEQYTDMVLSYIRLGSKTNDLVIESYPLDEIIRECIRKYSSQFILKKLSLDYVGTDIEITTDKKMLGLIVEQILSNAIKYTKEGRISITIAEGIVKISDTGIGISEADIPRIFEKGYTGYNGRDDEKSSGLGLYLCSMAADKLRLPIDCESKVGVGTTFSINIKNFCNES